MSADCKCRSSPHGGDNSAPPNTLAKFEGPLRRVGKRWKREGMKGKGKEGKGQKARETHPGNKFLVTALIVRHFGDEYFQE